MDRPFDQVNDELTASEDRPGPLNERQALIVAQVREQGFVTIDKLAQDFSVSAQTVRREIIRLDSLGLLKRFHGGAGRLEGQVRFSYADKQSLETAGKERIGRAMADEVGDGQSVYLDVGTTAEATARALTQRTRLTVVTNSMVCAGILGRRPGIEVIVTGGRVVGPDGSLSGPAALQTLRRYRLDWAIISCSGFDGDAAVLDFDADKIAVKQLALTLARQSALVADGTKFARSALIEVAPLADFSVLVTDKVPPLYVSDALSLAGQRLRLAS